MKAERPTRIIPSKGRGHKTETRVLPREIHESFCVQKGCKFFGKRAQQGVCFSSESGLAGKSWKHIKEAERTALELVKGIKRHAKNKSDYVRSLESYLICTWMNSEFTLDELIYLRKELALLKLKLEK